MKYSPRMRGTWLGGAMNLTLMIGSLLTIEAEWGRQGEAIPPNVVKIHLLRKQELLLWEA